MEEKVKHTYQSLPETLPAQWEIAEMILDEMTTVYPHYFSVSKKGDRWFFSNYLLDEEETFRFGDDNSLPVEPLHFIGRHIQEDLFYLISAWRRPLLGCRPDVFPGKLVTSI
ncbi:DUF3445 domain-containing protein [Terrilactibacillus sp. S3-3]|nr:DUF3445 domain-containing protein [Terrilactibacillus sp. S3-3]